MNFVKKHKVELIAIVCLFIMLLSVLLWNYVSKKYSNKKDNDNILVDISDFNNVDSVEAKLGEDIKITQGYLLNYTSKKASIWYMSKAYVNNVKKEDRECVITLTENKDSNLSIKSTIDINKCDVKKDNEYNFVGTIDIKNGSIELSKISSEAINYQNVTNVNFNDLVNNIIAVKNNHFIIMGYMVTDNDKYKLYDSKDAYTKDSSAGNYFLIDWKEKFMYTGNQYVSVDCLLEDTYKLKECKLVE